MYDYTYIRYIYEWLTDTFYQNWQTKIDSILTKLDSILTFVQWGLHLGVFALFIWLVITFLKPHLFKI